MKIEFKPQNPAGVHRLIATEIDLTRELSARFIADYSTGPEELKKAEFDRLRKIGRFYGVINSTALLAVYGGVQILRSYQGKKSGVFSSKDRLALASMAMLPVVAGQLIPYLYRAQVQKSLDRQNQPNYAYDQPTLVEHKPTLTDRAGFVPKVLRMWTPNLINLPKLAGNLRHPVGEIFHTRHYQYPLDEEARLFLVEHHLFERIVTVDLVKPSSLPEDEILSTLQLVHPRYYVAHADFFPQPCELVDRTFVQRGTRLDIDQHIMGVADNRQSLLEELRLDNRRLGIVPVDEELRGFVLYPRVKAGF